MSERAAPNASDELRLAWLSSVLSANSESNIESFDVEDIGTGVGVFGEIVRLKLTWSPSDAKLPNWVVAKFPSQDAQNLEVAAGLKIYPREVGFFERLAQVTPLRSPKCYHAQLMDDTRFVRLLEDLGQGYQLGDQLLGATATQVVATARALADLHASWWKSPDVEALDWIPRSNEPSYLATVPPLYSAGLAILESGGERDRELLGFLKAVERQIPKALHTMASDPVTLCHGDPRLDNIFFASDGSPVFIDFQLMLRQRGASDLGHLMLTSVEPEIATANWQQALDAWYRALLAQGVQEFEWEDAVRHYKLSVAYYSAGAMAMLALETGNERGAALTRKYVERLRHALDIDAIVAL